MDLDETGASMSMTSFVNSNAYPVCANGPLVQRSSFTDIDAQAAQLIGHDQEYHQLSPGAFRGGFITAELGPKAWLFVEETNQTLIQQGSTPTGQCSFLFMLDADGWCRFQGQDFTARDLGVLTGFSPYSVRCPAGSRFCVITIETDAVGDGFHLDCSALKTTGRLVSPQIESIVAALRSLVRTTLSVLHERSDPIHAEAMMDGLRRALMSTLSLTLSSQLPRSATGDHRLFNRACEVVDAGLREIDVSTLCKSLNVPRRTLELTFHRELGVGPARYIKAMRLNNIRREIVSGAHPDRPLADIAASWGLWHPSHFTESYTEMFGHLPSRARQGL